MYKCTWESYWFDVVMHLRSNVLGSSIHQLCMPLLHCMPPDNNDNVGWMLLSFSSVCSAERKKGKLVSRVGWLAKEIFCERERWMDGLEGYIEEKSWYGVEKSLLLLFCKQTTERA